MYALWFCFLKSHSERLDSLHISVSIMLFRHCDGVLQLILYAVIQQTTRPASAAPPAFDKNRGKLKSWTWIMNPMKAKSPKALSRSCLLWIFFLHLFWPPSHLTLVLYFSFNLGVFICFHFLNLVFLFYFFILLKKLQLLSYSLRARQTEGERRKKVSNDDNTQFDKTDKGLN